MINSAAMSGLDEKVRAMRVEISRVKNGSNFGLFFHFLQKTNSDFLSSFFEESCFQARVD